MFLDVFHSCDLKPDKYWSSKPQVLDRLGKWILHLHMKQAAHDLLQCVFDLHPSLCKLIETSNEY